jgi:uncharacterized protein (DUF736 family)
VSEKNVAIVKRDRDDDPDAPVHRGLDAVVARFADMSDAWAELRLEPHEFIDEATWSCRFA